MTTSTRDSSHKIHGFDLHWCEWGEPDADRPLVMLHGGTGVGSDWLHLFPEAPEGFRCLAPDLRGHGASTNPEDIFSIRQLGEDLLELLDRLGIERFDALGMSLGAKVLLRSAPELGERLGSMVLVSAAPYFPPQARELMALATPEAASQEQLAELRGKHPRGEGQIQSLLRHLHELKDSYDDLALTPPQLARIRARTLIVHGDRDPLYPVSLAFGLFEGIPESRLWVVPGGGHVPIFGDLAGPFVDQVLAFLSS